MKRTPLRDRLIPKGRTIFFNEEAHKYTNELGIPYTSMTTVIKKYEVHKDFETIAKACEAIGKNPRHPKYEHYKGKTWKQLITKWEDTTKTSCEFGTNKHSYLEQTIKNSNGYNRNNNGYINDKIATLDDIIEKHNYGRLKIEDFKATGIDQRYPEIFAIVVGLVKAGYYIYAEIGVYDDKYGISGLIDILCINHKTLEFIILDWKTNKAPIRFDAGHYEKQKDGRLDLDKWKSTNDKMQFPLDDLDDSTGNHYALQLSGYAYLVSTFGYKFKGIILCHIRPIEHKFLDRSEWEEVVEIYPIQYLENKVKLMMNNHMMNNMEQQTKLMLL